MNDQERAIVGLINRARGERGLRALACDGRMNAAARRHAADLAQHPGLLHIGSDGSTGGQRLFDAGYRWQSWNEVVGWGFDGSPEQMVAWWLMSPDHMPKLLDPAMTDVGAGYAFGVAPWFHYWAIDFAAGDSGAAAAYLPGIMGGG